MLRNGGEEGEVEEGETVLLSQGEIYAARCAQFDHSDDFEHRDRRSKYETEVPLFIQPSVCRRNVTDGGDQSEGDRRIRWSSGY